MADVSVSFGADTSDLLAKLAIAQRELRTSTREMQSFAAQVVSGGSNADTARAALTSWAAETEHARLSVAALQHELREGGAAGQGVFNRNQMLEAGHVARAFFDEIAAGQSPMRALAVEGGRIGQIIATMNTAALMTVGGWAALALGVGGATAALGMFILQARATGEAVQQVQMAASMGTAFDLTKAKIQELLTELKKMPDMSLESAQEVLAGFTMMRDASAPLIAGVVHSLEDFAKTTGEKAPEAAKHLRDLFNNPLDAGRRLQEMFPALTASEMAYYNEAVRTGSVSTAQAALLQIVNNRMAESRALIDERIAAQIRLNIEMAEAASVESGYISGINAEKAALEEVEASRQKRMSSITAETEALRKLNESPQQQIKIGMEVAQKDNTLPQQIDETVANIHKLEAALGQLKSFGGLAPIGELAPPNASAEIERITAAIDQEKQKLQELTDTRNGGSASQLAELANLREAALGKENAYNATLKLIAAYQEEANAATTANARRVAETHLLTATRTLREQEAASTKASADLQAAQAVKGSAEEFAAKERSIRATQALYAEGTAQHQQYETQLVNLADQKAEQTAQIAREEENTRYEIALQGIQTRISLVRQEAQSYQISHQDELAQLLALTEQKRALEEQHLAFRRASYADDFMQQVRIQNQQLQLESNYARQRQSIHQQVNKQIVDDYRRSFEQVGNSVSGEIMSMIRGQATFGQAVRNVGLSMVQSFIQARIRMVADWMAGQAAQLAITNASEASKTAAVAAGETARSGIMAAGATAAQGVTFSAMITQILASAKQTFAGIFGFLSPIMGPAAAGPAAAGMGVVASMASFAVGSWSLPSDMIAQVHQGEMIVPAAATPWAQNLMANAASGNSGGVSGGGVSINFAPIVYGNVSQQTIRSWVEPLVKEIQRQQITKPGMRFA